MSEANNNQERERIVPKGQTNIKTDRNKYQLVMDKHWYICKITKEC